MHQHSTYVKRKKKDEIVIGNGALERVISIRNRQLRTVAFRNLLTGRTFPVKSDEFILECGGRGRKLSNRDFIIERTALRPAAAGGARLEALLKDKSGATVTVIYEASNREPVMRKRIVVESERLVRSIAVEAFALRGHAFAFGGFGQPVFIDNELFCGLEYPAGYNLADAGGSVRLQHFPGRTGMVESKTAVLGAAADLENARVRDAFLDYIDRHRARPAGYFSQLGEVMWRYPARRALEAMSCPDIFDAARAALIRRGIKLDSVYFHGDRQTFNPQSLLGELPASRQKPFTLRRRVQWARQKLDAGVVMHLNTGGGRSSGDQAWFARHVDMINQRYYCLADPQVIESIKANLLSLVRKYDLKGFSFDWMWWIRAWECGARNHRGHIAGRKYGREAITDRFIELCQALRAAKPDIILEDLEVELSPWWLFYADALWSYAGEGDKIPFEEIDGAIKHWGARHIVYPLSSIWYATPEPEVPFGRNYPDEHMLHYVLLHYLRGGQMEEFYFNFSRLAPAAMDRVAAIIKWARSRQNILLANSAPVLGDPFRQEVYGYAHFTPDNRGIIGIRNPAAWRNASARLRLDEQAHFYQKGGSVRVEVVYPYRQKLPGLYNYGDTLEYDVPGDEIIVLETFPAEKPLPAMLASKACGKVRLAPRPSPDCRLVRRGRAVSLKLRCDVPADECWELVVGVEATMRRRTSLSEQMRLANRRLAWKAAGAGTVQAGGIEVEAVRDEYAGLAARFLQSAPEALAGEFRVNGKAAGGTMDIFTVPRHRVNDSGCVEAAWLPSGMMRIQKVGPHPRHANVLVFPWRFRLPLRGSVDVDFNLRRGPNIFDGVPASVKLSAHVNVGRTAPEQAGPGAACQPGGLPEIAGSAWRSTLTLVKTMPIFNAR